MMRVYHCRETGQTRTQLPQRKRRVGSRVEQVPPDGLVWECMRPVISTYGVALAPIQSDDYAIEDMVWWEVTE